MQDPTPALAAALEAGYTAADLHRLVDQAAASVTRARPSLTPPKPELLGPVKDRRHGRGRQAHNKLSPLNKVGAQQLPHQRVPEGPPQDGPNQAAPSVQHPVDLKLVAEAGQAGGSTEAQQHGRQGSSVHDETASAQDQHSHHWSADPTSNVKGNSHGAGASFTELLNGEGDLPQLELQQGTFWLCDHLPSICNHHAKEQVKFTCNEGALYHVRAKNAEGGTLDSQRPIFGKLRALFCGRSHDIEILSPPFWQHSDYFLLRAS